MARPERLAQSDPWGRRTWRVLRARGGLAIRAIRGRREYETLAELRSVPLGRGQAANMAAVLWARILMFHLPPNRWTSDSRVRNCSEAARPVVDFGWSSGCFVA